MKIASKDATKLITILIVSKILFSDINIFVKGSMSASYLEALVCSLTSLIIFFVISLFFRNSKSKDIFEAIEFSFGKSAKKVIGTLFLIIILSYTALILKLYTDAILTIAYPNSPAFFIMLFIILTMVISAYFGIGTIAKFSSVSVSVMLVFLAILFLLASKNIDVTNIYPVLGNGAGKIFSGSKKIFMFNEITFLFLISAFLENKKEATKIGFKSLIYSSIIIVISTLIYTLCIPYPASKLFNMPLLQLASSTDLSFFLQRSEGIFFILWIFSSFLYLSSTFYFSLYTFERTFDLKDIKAMIPSFIVIVFSSTWFFKNTKIIENYYMFFAYVFIVFSFLIPLLVYFFETIKRRRKNV